MTNQICRNCDNHFTGDYCNKCGQKTTHRITMGHIGHDMLHAFTHTDKGFFYLMLQLFVRPGIVAREYIVEGKRKRYFTPFQYILIIGAIAAFVAVNSHFIETTVQSIGGDTIYSAKKLAFIQKITSYQSRYYNFLILIQLPFYALATFLVFRKHRFNYAEHLTLQTFITAQTTILAMLVMLIIFLMGKTGLYLASVMSLISAAFQIFAYRQFFLEKNVKGIFKALLANILGMVFFMIFMMIVVLVYGVVTKTF